MVGEKEGGEYFNPLPPGGGRLREFGLYRWDDKFQSTPSGWRETARERGQMEIKKFQSTPSGWRETTGGLLDGCCNFISIHSLRVEGDTVAQMCSEDYKISIHSLRVEGDIVD